MSTSKDVYIKAHSKSYPLVMLLTIILGPLGLFYSSWVGALILWGCIRHSSEHRRPGDLLDAICIYWPGFRQEP